MKTLLVGLAVTAAALLAACSNAPAFPGRTITYWLPPDQYVQAGDPCQEDEVLAFIDNDTRACVPVDDLCSNPR